MERASGPPTVALRADAWLASEPLLCGGDSTEAGGAAAAIGAELGRALRGAWRDQPESLSKARTAVLQRLTQLDELRAALQRVAERIDRDVALAAQLARYDDEWRARCEQRWGGPRGRPAADEDPLRAWHREIAEALANWRLDACRWLVGQAWTALPPEAVSRARAALAMLGGDGDPALVAWLDHLTARNGPLDDPAATQWRRALLVLKARVQLQDRQEHEAARATLEAAADGPRGPGSARVDAAWGELLQASGQASDAQAAFDRAIATAPELPDGHIGRGRLEAAEDRWDDADRWFDRAIECVPAGTDRIAALQHLRLPCPARALLRLAQAATHGQAGPDPQAREALDLALRRADQADDALDDDSRVRALRQRAALNASDPASADAAAADLREAARLSVAHDPRTAAELFEQANGLAPSEPGSDWRLADALLMTSHLTQPPHVDADALARALAAWERAAARDRPREPWGWAYLTRAVIAERQAELDADRHDLLLWEGVELAERALVFDARHGYAWSTLARLHRALENAECALQASGQGVDAYRSDVYTLEEHVIMLVNTSRYTDALPAIDRYRELGGEGAWIDAVQAHVMMHGQDDAPDGPDPAALEQALALTTAMGDAIWTWPWVLRDRARILERLGRRGDAVAEWRRMLDPRLDVATTDRHDLALALILCDEFEQAFELIGRLRAGEQPSQRETSERLTGIALLLRARPGDLQQARRHFDTALALSTPLALRSWLLGNAADVQARLTHDGAARAEQHALLRDVIDQARTTLRSLPRRDNPVAELRHLLAVDSEFFAPGSGTRRGLLATLARSCREAGDFASALDGFVELARERPNPWQRAVDATVEAWGEELGSTRAGAEAVDAALDALRRLGLERSAVAVPLLACRAAVAVDAGAAATAETTLFRALEAAAADPQGAGAGGRRLAAALADRGGAAADIGRVDAMLGRIDVSTRPALAEAVRSARNELLAALQQALNLSARAARSAGYALAVAPLRLYLGRRAFELAGADDFDARFWAMLRARVQRDTGMRLPDIALQQFGGDTHEEQAYLIAMDDLGLAGGQIRPGERFVPEPPGRLIEHGVPAWQVTAATDPRTGAAGCWLHADAWQAAADLGLEPWPDALSVVVEHVDVVLRPLLAELFRLEHAAAWLAGDTDADGDTSDATAQCQQISADPADLLRLTQLLRALLAEGVPISDRQAIVAAFVRSRDDGPDATLRAARLALRAQLAGNAAGMRRMALPSELEFELLSWCDSVDGRGWIAMPPDDANDVLSSLRSLLSDAADGKALVVRSAELRAPLQRITAFEHPGLQVLWLGEADEPVDGASAANMDPTAGAATPAQGRSA